MLASPLLSFSTSAEQLSSVATPNAEEVLAQFYEAKTFTWTTATSKQRGGLDVKQQRRGLDDRAWFDEWSYSKASSAPLMSQFAEDPRAVLDPISGRHEVFYRASTVCEDAPDSIVSQFVADYGTAYYDALAGTLQRTGWYPDSNEDGLFGANWVADSKFPGGGCKDVMDFLQGDDRVWSDFKLACVNSTTGVRSDCMYTGDDSFRYTNPRRSTPDSFSLGQALMYSTFFVSDMCSNHFSEEATKQRCAGALDQNGVGSVGRSARWCPLVRDSGCDEYSPAPPTTARACPPFSASLSDYVHALQVLQRH